MDLSRVIHNVLMQGVLYSTFVAKGAKYLCRHMIQKYLIRIEYKIQTRAGIKENATYEFSLEIPGGNKIPIRLWK